MPSLRCVLTLLATMAALPAALAHPASPPAPTVAMASQPAADDPARLLALLARSPSLAQQAQALSNAGVLRGVSVVPAGEPLSFHGRPRSAALVGGVMTISAELLTGLQDWARRRHLDSTDMAVVYILAHQVGHAMQDERMQALMAELRAVVAAEGDRPGPQSQAMQQRYADAMLEMEAVATLTGWNYTVDAWLHDQQIPCGPQDDPDISTRQVLAQATLMDQMAHIEPILPAMRLDNGQALKLSAHGIEDTAHNRAALLAGLRSMPQALEIE